MSLGASINRQTSLQELSIEDAPALWWFGLTVTHVIFLFYKQLGHTASSLQLHGPLRLRIMFSQCNVPGIYTTSCVVVYAIQRACIDDISFVL